MNLPHRDRSVALAVVGSLEIMAGLGLIGLGAVTAVAVMAAPALKQQVGWQAGSMILVLGIYAGLGLAAIIVGGGLIACKRWARSLSLIASAGLAILGVILAIAYALLVPAFFAEMPATVGGMPEIIIMTVLAVAFALLVLVVPGSACAWILAGDDARLTCEWRDRTERWTDRCPLPVLALALLHVVGAPFVLGSAFTSPAIVAGRLVTGAPAIAFYLGMGVVMALLAWGLYRRQAWAWWGDVLLYALSFLNCWTLLRPGVLDEYYRSMGMPEGDIALSTALLNGDPMMVLIGLSVAGMAAWLLLVRKHFVGPSA